MAKIPRSEPTKQIGLQAPSVRENVAAAGSFGRDIQGVAGASEKIFQKFEDAQVLDETMRATTEANRRLKELQLNAETEPDIWDTQKFTDEINTIREESAAAITLPRAKGEFQFKFDGVALTADTNIKSTLRRRQVDSVKTAMLENLDSMKSQYTDAASPQEQAVVLGQRDALLQENVKAGIITNEKAFDLKKKTLKEWQESDIRQAIASDATIAKDMLLDGQFGELTADETAKWIEVVDKQLKRNKKVAELKIEQRHLDNEGELFGNLQNTTVQDVIDMTLNDEISPQVGNDLIEWKTDPEGPQYETDKTIALEILRDSLTPGQDIRKFHERIAKALKEKDIKAEDAFNLTQQVQDLFDISESFKTQSNPFSKAFKAAFDFTIDRFSRGLPGVAEKTAGEIAEKSFDAMQELAVQIKEKNLAPDQIRGAIVDILKEEMRSENPSILGLDDVPNAITQRGQDIKALNEGVAEIKPDQKVAIETTMPTFDTVEEALAANLPSGTFIKVGEKTARID